MIALVTGANRGLGFGICENLAAKNHTVIMTGRDLKSLQEKQKQLAKKNLDVHAIELDLNNPESIEKSVAKILADFKRIDILINNAGILKDGLKENVGSLADVMSQSFQTNTIGPALMIQAILPSMKKNNYGRIVNVSSGMASLTEMQPGYIAYRSSKTALNAVTCVYAHECKEQNILINSVCPGWVKTDMGGASAHRTIPEGVSSIVWAAEIPEDGPSGGFFRDGKPLSW